MLSEKHREPMDEPLPRDATIASVIHTLDKPEDYVRGVLGNMLHHKREFGGAQVRIGTTGRGIVPHYQIEAKGSFETTALADALFKDVVFNGRNHERLPWDWTETKGDHWGTATMSFEEVQGLLGDLRHYKHKAR